MDVKLACTHQHHLFYDDLSDKQCEACRQKDFPIYTCLRCKIRIHESCLKKLHHYQLPEQINHPLHPQQHLQLQLQLFDFVCNKCSYISSGYRYGSNEIYPDFNLDLTCAASLQDRLYSEEEFKLRKIVHYGHIDQLTIFKYRKVKEGDYNCTWCGKHLFDPQLYYGCMRCKFFLHESCSEKIPRTIYHPFHPSHPLRLHFIYVGNFCKACGLNILGHTSYWCHICDFRIDFRCAKLSPTLKHTRHNHLLACFGNISQGSGLYCNVCTKQCEVNFYRCVQCYLSFHLNCLPIPSSAEHRYHRHPLSFTNSIKEDDSDEYYCDICEDERNPMEPVYCCKQCTYIGHIHCVLNKDKISLEEIISSTPKSLDGQAMLVNEAEHSNENENISQDVQLNDPFLHIHPTFMKFCYAENEEFKESPYCHACRLELAGPSYICTICPVHKSFQLGSEPGKGFYLHEKCTKLPHQIQHPFHSMHPLYLYTTYRPQIGIVRCDECGDISFGFIYLCERCNFKIDVKCAALTAHETHEVLQQKEMEIVTQLHPHKLLLGNYNDPIIPLECLVCELSTSGPIYFCPNPNCSFSYVHESCLKLPQKLQLPFHDPKHELVFRHSSNSVRCSACPSSIPYYCLRYSCEQCHDFDLHSICAIECANSSRRPLKCDLHVHNLFYFGTNYQLLSERYRNRKPWMHQSIFCKECGGGICSEAFYRCLQSQCEINFHLECIPLPYIVNSRCHIHPLTLRDSFIEDDSGEYYCDVCEEERRSNDHTYCCESCNGLFVAHIECVFAKVEKGLSYVQKPQRKNKLPSQQIGDSLLQSNSSDNESPIHSSAQEEEEDSTTLEEEEREDSTNEDEEDSTNEDDEDSFTLEEEEKENSTAQEEEDST